MNLETESRTAFELVASALDEIRSFQEKRELTKLENARNKLTKALKEDPDFLDAVYYSGMVYDLNGQAESAIPQFEQVRQADPPFLDEVEYNLGVAYYHRYHLPQLDLAIEHFNKAINRTKDHSLRALARAGLAQAYGMKVLHKDPKENFDHCKEQAEQALRELETLGEGEAVVVREGKWTAHNACAISSMFLSDHETTNPEERRRLLDDALIHLDKALGFSPNNWAIECNYASVLMRLGSTIRDLLLVPDSACSQQFGEPEVMFTKALGHLGTVIKSLRPNYAFALYEIGRVYRVKGDFDQAVEYFGRALEIPESSRDVSDLKINRERARAVAGDLKFP